MTCTEGSPARAGIAPEQHYPDALVLGLPRPRGDSPLDGANLARANLAPPPARG